MDAEAAIAKLMSPEIESEIRGMIDAGVGTKEDARVAIEEALGARDSFVEVLRPIDDEEQVMLTLAIHYIEMKSRWIALNTKMNYSLFRTGNPDEPAMLRGTAMSTLLMLIEGMLTPDDVDQITEFLAEPIGREREAA